MYNIHLFVWIESLLPFPENSIIWLLLIKKKVQPLRIGRQIVGSEVEDGYYSEIEKNTIIGIIDHMHY